MSPSPCKAPQFSENLGSLRSISVLEVWRLSIPLSSSLTLCPSSRHPGLLAAPPVPAAAPAPDLPTHLEPSSPETRPVLSATVLRTQFQYHLQGEAFPHYLI